MVSWVFLDPEAKTRAGVYPCAEVLFGIPRVRAPARPPPGAEALIFPSLDFLSTSHGSDWGSQKKRWDLEAESSEASTALPCAVRKQRWARDRALLFSRDPRWARAAFPSFAFRGRIGVNVPVGPRRPLAGGGRAPAGKTQPASRLVPGARLQEHSGKTKLSVSSSCP